MKLATDFGMKLLEIALPSLATVIAGLLVAFLTKKLQSIGITVSQQQQDRLKELAEHTVLAVEEQSRRKVMSSQQKDSAAVQTIKSKLPGADIADVRNAVDAALPTLRAKLTPISPGTLGRSIRPPA